MLADLAAARVPPACPAAAPCAPWLEQLTTTDRFFEVCSHCGGAQPTNGGRDAKARFMVSANDRA